jgi:5-methylcytosine-specific restriction protein A
LPVWKKHLRPAQLLREPFCRECAKHGRRTPATVVDHVRPFAGDWQLFIDPANHQSLCKRCHDRKTALEQAQKRAKNA